MSYRFDDVEIDETGFRLTKAGRPVHVEPKALEVLLFLASNPRRLVTKAELQEAVWRETFVTENALTRLVAQLRKALGDDARDARYIETVPTRGYRFVAPLRAPEPEAAPPPPRQRPRRLVAGAALAGFAAIGALAFSLLPDRAARSAARDAPTRALERQVSTSAGLNVSPAFSADGGSIAYATLRDGSLEIVVRALASGAREVAVTADGMQNLQPAFSPDGRRLAYHSVRRGGLWLVPALGGVPQPLTSFGSNPAWSPDGSTIAFQGQSWVGSAEGLADVGEGSTIWLVPAAGGAPRRLTSIEDVGPGGQVGPSWSPDGKVISFVAGKRVFSVRSDGGGLRRSETRLWLREAVWEPSGRSQLWTGSAAGNWYVWRVPVAPDTGAPAGEPEQLAGGGEKASAWSHPALSRDGRSVAYVTFRTRHELVQQKLTPDGRAAGEPEPLAAGIAGRKVPLRFSPDGRRLSFGMSRPGAGQALWVLDLSSGEARIAVEHPDLFWARAWSADGRRVGYVAPGTRERSFWTTDYETGETDEHRPVEHRPLDAHLSWTPMLSPDGRSLAAHGALRGALNIWRLDTAGGPARPLTHDAEGMGWPVWSPDGSRIAVEIMRGGNTHVGWLPAGGGPVREIVTAPGQSWPYSFSPDGRRIAFAGQRGGLWNVYWVPADGGEERRLSAYRSPALYVRYPEWSPAGDRLVYEKAESTSTVWVTDLVPPVR